MFRHRTKPTLVCLQFFDAVGWVGLVLPFWYWLIQVVPDKGQLNGCSNSRCHTICMWNFTASS